MHFLTSIQEKTHHSSIYWCMPSHCTPNNGLTDAPPMLPTVQTWPHQISICSGEGPTLRKWCSPGQQHIQACAALAEMPGSFWGFYEIVTDIFSKSRWYLLLDKYLCFNIKYMCSWLSVQPLKNIRNPITQTLFQNSDSFSINCMYHSVNHRKTSTRISIMVMFLRFSSNRVHILSQKCLQKWLMPLIISNIQFLSV
jgi:hypothetical protein